MGSGIFWVLYVGGLSASGGLAGEKGAAICSILAAKAVAAGYAATCVASYAI